MSNNYKTTELIDILKNIVRREVKKGSDSVMCTKIKNIYYENESSVERTAYDLYVTLITVETKDGSKNKLDGFDEHRGKFSSYVYMILNHTLIDLHRKDVSRNKYEVVEDIALENAVCSNSSKCHSTLESNNVVDLFKKFYTDDSDIIDSVVCDDCDTLKEAVISVGRSVEYEKILKRFRRSRDSFNKFLNMNGTSFKELYI